VPGQVHHDRAPDRLAGQAGSRAAGQHRNAEPGGGDGGGGDVVGAAGKTTPIGSIAYMLASRENRCLL